MNDVDVCLALCTVAGMERQFLLPRRPDTYIGWQHAVESAFNIRKGNIPGRDEINHLAERVNSGICPSGAVYLYRVIKDPFNGMSYDLLYGNAVGLTLPSMVIGALILNNEGYISRVIRFHNYFIFLLTDKRGVI